MAQYIKRADLIAQLDEAEQQVNAVVMKADATISSMQEAIKDLHDRQAVANVKTRAYKDLLDQLTETASLGGLNETQINAKLNRRMMLLKYYFDK